MKTKMFVFLSLIVALSIFVSPAMASPNRPDSLPSNVQKIIVTGLTAGEVVSINGDRGIRSDGGSLETFAPLGQPVYVTAWTEDGGTRLLGIVFPKFDSQDVIIDAGHAQLAQGDLMNRGLASPMQGMDTLLHFAVPNAATVSSDDNNPSND